MSSDEEITYQSATVDLLAGLAHSLGEERVMPLTEGIAAATPEEQWAVEEVAAELVNRDWPEWFLEQLGGALVKAQERTRRQELGEF